MEFQNDFQNCSKKTYKSNTLDFSSINFVNKEAEEEEEEFPSDIFGGKHQA